ncbi:Na(+)-translocating NADH-quinone reductase subunit A [Mangrovivirga cuniculi]|uniref:Na(+)-translocating NADH-quinone reductase subunit A n=1 Tax=Mangrovivirga cuniculi TaxID=2715131 RepID=A0A4D7JS21_9BACT|nr:Na(+)-translocating NADH-quinone reductase subunit A [Mangrovivirga cuniculi]QCK14746.1 NADH:ubiquinone reductase (Na(+)-transporting) subunit A [Mangrovivirga cuniculi]
MSKTIKLKRGFDINLAGKAEKKLVENIKATTYAFKPTDFEGIMRPKLLVKEGDTVKAGTPILYDKKNDAIKFTAPVSGEVVEIVRGKKRKLLEIKILADSEIVYEEFNKFSVSDIESLDAEKIKEQLLKSGVWPNLIQRPYGILANPEENPKAIFISGFDTNPLAPDTDYLLKGQEQYFQAGINILKKLTSGKVHLNLNASGEVSSLFSQIQNVEINKFSGPHPAGNVGVQIHHIDPINKGDIAWTVKPFGVAQIGKLFLEGKYDTKRVIALAGSEVKNPQYYSIYTGACVDKLLENNLNTDNVRVVSGNVLTGRGIKKTGYVGYFDDLVTVIPEGDEYEFLGWILPSTKKVSFHRAFGLLAPFFAGKNKEFVVDTNLHGEPRAFVETGSFEKVTPMDIYPEFLIKAIMAEDFDEMEALGIYEVIEEDLALCEFVDVSKHDIQKILREGINLLQFS